MYRKALLLFAIFALLLAACAAPAATEEPAQTPDEPVVTDPSPNDPVTSETGDPEETEEPSYEPQPGDDDLIRQEVEIESVEILTLESFPPQFNVHITGTKGNPCALLRIVTGEPDEDGRIDIEVYVVVDPAAVCVQVLESFDVTVPLGSLPAGEYNVYVNGELAGEIAAP